jgi:hypothetical protein
MARTEIVMIGGERRAVEGNPRAVEATILSAARGALLEFAWLTDADSGEALGVNPDQVQMLRVLDPGI